jgi:hypothetical protein
MDYPLLAFQQTKNIQRVTFFGQGTALDIRGLNFRDITGVIVNGVRSPVFVTVSPTRILADIPAGEVGVIIRSVAVLTANVSGSKASIVSFEAAVSAQQLGDSGLLVQRFLKVLLTTQGSDIFAPQAGGNLLALIGEISESERQNVEALAMLYVQQAEEVMITSQARNPQLPDSAKLGRVTVLRASYSPQETALDIRLRIQSLDGTVAIAGLAL